jgi:hypothetical protein
MLVFPGAHFTYYLLYDLFWRYIDRTIHIEVEFPEYILSLMTILYNHQDWIRYHNITAMSLYMMVTIKGTNHIYMTFFQVGEFIATITQYKGNLVSKSYFMHPSTTRLHC